MLTFSPLTKDGEPVVRPPKKGEWYLRTRDPCVEQAEYDFTFFFPIYRAVPHEARMASERALVEACEHARHWFATVHGERDDNAKELTAALAAARSAGIGGPT